MSTYEKRVDQKRKNLQNIYEEDLRQSKAYLTQQSYPNSAPNLAALKDRIGPLHVVNGHMPIAADEVAELRRPATLRHIFGFLINLGASLGFMAFVLFLLSRAAS